MAEFLSIARPYAQALFELAASQNSEQKWLEILQVLGQIAEDHRSLHVFKNPNLTTDQLVQFLLSVLPQTLTAKFVKSEQSLLHNFIKILAENKRLILLPAIFSLFSELLREQKKVVKLKVSSPFIIQEKTKEKLVQALEKKFQNKVEIDYIIDADLIGGAVIRSGNWVLDGSLKNRLQSLTKTFRHEI